MIPKEGKVVNGVWRPATCSGCPYSSSITVGTKGDPKSPLVFVGESPGTREVGKGYPFVGPSGELLEKTLPKGSNPADYYYLNAMQCRPVGKKKEHHKLVQGATSCQHRLYEQLKAHPRKVIIAMGNPAMWACTGDFSLKSTQDRGKLIVNKDIAEVGILLTNHPAFLLRGGGSYRQFREDIHYAFRLAAGAPPRHIEDPEWQVFDSEADVDKLVDFLLKQPEVAADIETTGFNPREDRIICIQFSWGPNKAAIVPAKYISRLKRLFQSTKTKFIWHNGKFDSEFLQNVDLPARVDEDTMLLSYTLDEIGGIHDLEQVAGDVIGAPDYKNVLKPYLAEAKEKLGREPNYDDIPKSVLYHYGAADTRNTYGIFKVYREDVRQDEALERLYTKTLIPASALLQRIERNGIYVDHERVAENKVVFEERLKVQEAELNELLGHEINPRSPKQVAEALYDELKLPTKHGRSTDKDVLKLLPQVPFVKLLQKIRKDSKSLSTYIKGVPSHVESDGRIHSTYKLHGTVTGRLSSSEPNLQNIPRDPILRGQFAAPKGKIFVEVDLNQAELRSLCTLSRDVALTKIYTDPTSIGLHNEVSIALFGENFTNDDKMRAKAVNFGIVYGREAPSFAEEFKMPVKEGQRWIDDWFLRFPQAADFIKNCRSAPIRNAVMVTCFGRKKRWGVVSREQLRGLMNEAANFPHQSIASDITLHAAMKADLSWYPTRLENQLEKLGAIIVNLVHDSILVECDDNPQMIQDVAWLVKNAMEQVAPEWGLNVVPFTAEAKVGYRWGNLEDLKLVA